MKESSELPATPVAVIGVSALNRMARDLLEHALPLMWVRGEISNFTSAASGHWYFTLKDAAAQVRCALFRHKARYVDWRPENGMQVEVRALVTLYEPRGEFQLNVESMRRAGVGALYEAYERLKSKLDAEGLFDSAHKRELPAFPRAIGVVTSAQAAALRDVLTILARRMPSVPVIVYPTPVQGAGAGPSIAAAIQIAATRNECDVLIVCRGGGSIEDLWAFNDEVVARAIYACPIPLVTGVGHETDFTIADFVADVRAPTPSAAAQAACPDRIELERQRSALAHQLRRSMQRYFEVRMQDLDYLSRRLLDPGERLRREAEHLAHLEARMAAAFAGHFARSRLALAERIRRLTLARPEPYQRNAEVQQAALRLETAAARNFAALGAAIENLAARLTTLNPHAVLERGYAIATDSAGHIVRDSTCIRAGDQLDIRFARGSANTKVTTTAAGD